MPRLNSEASTLTLKSRTTLTHQKSNEAYMTCTERPVIPDAKPSEPYTSYGLSKDVLLFVDNIFRFTQAGSEAPAGRSSSLLRWFWS